MGCGIAQKIIPFRGPPEFVALVIIEANQISGDDVEFAVEFWQRLKCINARNGARYLQEPGQLAEHRQIIQIEAKNFVAEQFVDVEKIPGAAAKIEDARTRGIIETELAHS